MVGASRKLSMPEVMTCQKRCSQDKLMLHKINAHKTDALINPASTRSFLCQIRLSIKSGNVKMTRWGFIVNKIRQAPARNSCFVVLKNMNKDKPSTTNVLTCPIYKDTNVAGNVKKTQSGSQVWVLMGRQSRIALIKTTNRLVISQ